MANRIEPNPAVSGSCVVCNAESDAGNVSKKAVLEIIARQRAAFEHLNVAGGLSPDSPCRFTRERFEIVAGKLLCCDSITGLIRHLPPAAPANLMGEKPSLSSVIGRIEARAAAFAKDRAEARAKAFTFATSPEARESAMNWFNRADSVVSALSDLVDDLKYSAGSAEEQPVPREESRPVTGNSPVTPAGANPPPLRETPLAGPESVTVALVERWADFAPTRDLETACEAILDEIEARGGITHWSLTGY